MKNKIIGILLLCSMQVGFALPTLSVEHDHEFFMAINSLYNGINNAARDKQLIDAEIQPLIEAEAKQTATDRADLLISQNDRQRCEELMNENYIYGVEDAHYAKNNGIINERDFHICTAIIKQRFANDHNYLSKSLYKKGKAICAENGNDKIETEQYLAEHNITNAAELSSLRFSNPPLYWKCRAVLGYQKQQDQNKVKMETYFRGRDIVNHDAARYKEIKKIMLANKVRRTAEVVKIENEKDQEDARALCQYLINKNRGEVPGFFCNDDDNF